MNAETAFRRAAGSCRNGLARFSLGVVLLLLGACGSAGPRADTGEAASQVHPAPGAYSVAAAAPARGAALAANLVGSLLKTYTTDPVVRPVSTARSLGFLIKNSVFDFSRRVYVNAIRLPAIRGTPVPPVAGRPGMDLVAWEAELDRITGTHTAMGRLEFLVDGEGFFPPFIEAVEGARRSIQLRTYIFDNDDYAVRIADLLKARSRQVEVTVLMDGIGSLTGAHVAPASLPDAHVPPASMENYLQQNSRVKARALTNPWFTGDHRKLAVIDRRVAFLGGMNIGREYRYDWHDLMVRVEGPVVEMLARGADRAWARSGPLGDLAALLDARANDPGPPSASDYPLRILSTRASNSQIYNAKIAAIRRARSYIYIENPYFSDDLVLYELIRARRRGVDVRYIVSGGGDHPLMDLSNARAINQMLDNGIRVFIYPRMTHTKAAVIDGWLTVGSANLDNLSLRVNKELNVATSHPGATEALMRQLFDPDFAAAAELERALPEDLGNWLAEAFADVFL